MGDLIYTPGISLLIDSALRGLIDVSDDIEQASVNLVQNGIHRLQVTLANQRGKYDGVFAPNDRISCQLKRIRWLQIMSGYTTSVPYFSAYQGSITLTAECTLKTLKYFPWDARSGKAQQLLRSRGTYSDGGVTDTGGMGAAIRAIFTEVVKWPEEKVHVGGIPDGWLNKMQTVYDAINRDSIDIINVLGPNPLVSKNADKNFKYGTRNGRVFISGLSNYATYNLEGDMDVVLATIRNMEGGDSYTATTPFGTASGAYQVLDSVWQAWNGHGNYSRACLAPAELQDEYARQRVRSIYNNFGPYLIYVPIAWYMPAILSNPETNLYLLATPSSHGRAVADYADSWMTNFGGRWWEIKNTEPPAEVPESSLDNIVIVGPTPSEGGSRYPIPSGTNRLVPSDCVWGGYQIGHIPESAMSNSGLIGLGHPVAVMSWADMSTEASKNGFDLHGSCYREAGASSNEPSKNDIHGLGIAVDVQVLIPGQSLKYPTKTASEMYSTPEYLWLQANSYLYGWVQPSEAQRGGDNPMPWHWEFFAFMPFKDGHLPNTQSTGYNYYSDIGSQVPTSMTDLFKGISFWSPAYESDTLGEVLTGQRALMNDVPVITMIEDLVKAAGRVYCSAPNGDFIAWFPDYMNEYGTAGRLDVEMVEVVDFEVTWSDEGLITHQFVEGSYAGTSSSSGPLPGGVISEMQALNTRGVVTVDIPNLLRTLTNVTGSQYPWLADPQILLNRFGARVAREQVSNLSTAQEEFWYAINAFTQAWASQFSCALSTTFLPEAFPGMIIRIPAYGVQFYCSGVRHTIDLSGSNGFQTSLSLMSPSSIDGSGFFLFPVSNDYSSEFSNLDGGDSITGNWQTSGR